MNDICDTGVILAAGRGTRLYKLTRAIPKELLPIGGTPLVEFCLQQMKEAKIRKVIIVVGYHKKAIIDYVGDGSRYGLDVAYVIQDKQRGPALALLTAKNYIENNFCLMFGDDYLEPVQCVKKLVDDHVKNDSSATIGVNKVKDVSTTSAIRIENSVVKEIIEKPVEKELWDNFGSNGSFVLSPEVFDYIPKTKPGINDEVYLSDTLNLMVRKGLKVRAICNTDYYLDIGIIDKYIEANKRVIG
jgi:glucose-1-phosphate thymidylyltransferase